MSNFTVDACKLSSLASQIFLKKGLSEQAADLMAASLVEANLRGVASHGVVRIGNYVSRINNGGTNPNANIRIIEDTPISALLDGDNGLGAIVATKAVKIARDKAENTGFGCVVVRKSNHYGAAAYWAEHLAGDDMIGFSCTNVEALMVPTGAKKMAIGNNPFSVVVPAGKHPCICADMATSEISYGKILDFRLKNQPLADGWAVDKEGLPTKDPFAAEYLLPFGAHKGYSLAVVLEIFSSLLSGGDFGSRINSMYGQTDKPNNLSHCFIAMKINAFRNVDEFKADVDAFIDYLHQTPAVEGRRVLLPGEIEHNRKSASQREGIELPENLVKELTEIANSLGITDADHYFC